MGFRLSVRGRLILRRLVQSPAHVRWPANRVFELAGFPPAIAWRELQLLDDAGLVVRHCCDDAVVRFTASPAGRRLFRGSRDRDLGG